MKFNDFVYLDNYATIPCSEDNINFTSRYLKDLNPSASYCVNYRDKSYLIVEKLIADLSKIFNTNSNKIIINSGGSESNSSIIYSKGLFGTGEIVCSSLDHDSVLNGVYTLFKSGVPVKILEVKNGILEINDFDNLIGYNTSLLILTHVFSETGGLNEVFEIAKRIKSRFPKIHIHVDAVQSFKKLPDKVFSSGLNYIDSLAGSFHKIGGLKGCGFLWVANPKNYIPLIFGHQNNDCRGGTMNISGIASASYALQENKDLTYNKEMESYLKNKIQEYCGKEIFFFTPFGRSLGNCISIAFKGIDNRFLQNFLFDKKIIVGTGSACNSECVYKNGKISPIIKSFNAPEGFVKPIRISWSKKSSKVCLDKLLNELVPLIHKMMKRV